MMYYGEPSWLDVLKQTCKAQYYTRVDDLSQYDTIDRFTIMFWAALVIVSCVGISDTLDHTTHPEYIRVFCCLIPLLMVLPYVIIYYIKQQVTTSKSSIQTITMKNYTIDFIHDKRNSVCYYSLTFQKNNSDIKLENCGPWEPTEYTDW